MADPHPCFFEGDFAQDARLVAEMQRLALGSDIKSLGFFCCVLDTRAAQALAEALVPESKMRSLFFEMCSVRQEAIEALTRALPALPNLRTLGLKGPSLSPAGCRVLSESLPGSALRELDVSFSAIGDPGIAALAQVLDRAPLEKLFAERAQVTQVGARALGSVLVTASLRTLSLSFNRLGEEGGQALLQGMRNSGITQCLLKDTGCSDETLCQIENCTLENASRAFVLQVEGFGGGPALAFRTLAGSVAARLEWPIDKPSHQLAEALLQHMRAHGGGPLPFKQLTAQQLRLVLPDGRLL